MTHPVDRELADKLTDLVERAPEIVVEEIGRRMMLEQASGMLRGRLWSAAVIAIAAFAGPADPYWVAAAIAVWAILAWSISWGLHRWIPRNNPRPPR